MVRIFSVLLGILFSVSSYAHDGHDHSNPMSPLVHLVWISPLIIGAYLLVKYFKRRSNNVSTTSK